MFKIAHLADIHIRNLKYHDVYCSIFDDLYANLKHEKPDYIVVCGDIAHTKTQISPEYVKMASDFFINLANISKTIVIPGNHDGLIKNASRLDAISPIIENIKNPNLYFARDSKILSFKDIEFYHLSIFDRDNWPTPQDNKKIKVALYHGAINNVSTDAGYVLDHGDDKISIFNGFDFAMLGDIHKTNQIVDTNGTVRYPGSLITQNFGETNDKGYLLWEIKDGSDFDCKHVHLQNPKPFITITLTPKGKIPRNAVVPSNARLRLISEHPISLDAMKTAIDVVKMKFKPESVSYLNRSSKSKNSKGLLDDEYSKKNLRDLKVQEDMIKEYLKDYELDQEIINTIVQINKNINDLIEKNDDIARNVYWELNSVEFDNLFNYDEGNKINFEDLSGLIGIFGKSFSGKSSIIDSVLFTLFNNSSKSVRKNRDMINQNKSFARGKAILTINDIKYVIERKSEKYNKKLHGEVFEEAKTDVEFYQIDADGNKIENGDLAEETRSDTDKAIRHKIGNLEDFLVTSFAAQFSSLAFIDQKSTVRKKILAKFLDLEFFEDKFTEANNQSSDMRGACKMLERIDYEKEYSEIKEKKDAVRKSLKSLKQEKSNVLLQIAEQTSSLANIDRFIDSIPEELEEICHLEDDLDDKTKELNRSKLHLTSRSNELESKRKSLSDAKLVIENIDEQNLINAKAELAILKEKMASKFDDQIHFSNLIDRIEDAEKNISAAPCNSEYSSCQLVESSYEFLASLEASLNVREKLDKIKKEYEKLEEKEEKLTSLNIQEEMNKLDKMKKELSNLEYTEIPLLEVLVEKEKSHIQSIEKDLVHLESKMKQYEENKDKIDALEEKKIEKKSVITELKALKKSHESIEKDVHEMLAQQGYIRQKIENILAEREKLEQLRKEYAAYDLYKKCMHSNGIPFDIIKKRLPVINTEISKILANVVEFEVFFETNDNRLEIYLKHPKHGARLIETGSGAEKTLAATAIRLALLSVSSLPKGDIFILDEPATELDEENREGFLRILEMIKSYFSKVILISHLEPLKDVVDSEITIEKKNGYAHVEI